MKNLFKFLYVLFAAALMSCVQPSEEYYSSGNNSTNTETVTAGWYAYTTNAASKQKQVTYLYINADGSIEKAGSSKHEYTGTSLEQFAQLSYFKCKENSKNEPSNITFEPCDAPSWGADETGGNNENENENNTGSSGSDSYSPGIGCEWWCFENAHVGNLNVYVLYDQSGNPLKAGTNNKEDSTKSNLYMGINRETAVGNFRGKKYKITDYRNLPSWCF